MMDPNASTLAIAAFKERLKLVRNAFDRYFLGMDPAAPTRERELLAKALRALEGAGGGSTAQHFKLASLKASWVSAEAHWTRRLREMEESPRHTRRPKGPSQASGGMPKKQSEQGASVSAPRPVVQSVLGEEALSRLHKQLTSQFAHAKVENPPDLSSLAAEVNRRVAQAKRAGQTGKLEVRIVMQEGRPTVRVEPK